MKQLFLLDVPPDSVSLPSSQAPRRGETVNPVADEKARLHGNKLRVLEYLKAHGSATTAELSVPGIGGLGAPQRLHELRKQGHDIRLARVKGGTFRWTYCGIRSL